MFISRPSHTILAIACSALLSTVHAQSDAPRQKTEHEKTSDSKTPQQRTDCILASWITVINNNEIAMARAALSRAQTEEVKSFAKSVLDTHREFDKELAQFSAVDSASAMQSGADAASAEGTHGEDAETAEAAMKRKPAMHRPLEQDLDHIAMLEELGRQKMKSAKEALKDKRGVAYDKCFSMMQVFAHCDLQDKLEVFDRHASPALCKVFESMDKTVSKHYEQAMKITRQLDADRGDHQ